MTVPDSEHLSAVDAANLLAGQAVAEAEAFLAERRDATQCEKIVDQLWRALAVIEHPPIPEILDPVRLLIMALGRVALAGTDERRARWRRVLAALTDLVRHESLALRAAGPAAIDEEGEAS
jgi:hypothetical protein